MSTPLPKPASDRLFNLSTSFFGVGAFLLFQTIFGYLTDS